jgi:hypothetical protein
VTYKGGNNRKTARYYADRKVAKPAPHHNVSKPAPAPKAKTNGKAHANKHIAQNMNKANNGMMRR